MDVLSPFLNISFTWNNFKTSRNFVKKTHKKCVSARELDDSCRF